MENASARGRVIGVVLGLLALLIAYYWVHKPGGLNLLVSLGGAALDVLTAALLVTLAGGLGRRVLNYRFDPNSLLCAERVALESGLGLGTLSILILILGMAGLFNRLAFVIMLLAAGVLAPPGIRGWLADCRTALVGLRPTGRWERFLALFVGFALVTALLHAVAPPTAWDALMYHLAAPQLYLAEGRIVAHPDNHYFGFPQGVEMLFALPMGVLGRDIGAAVIHFLLGLLALLAAMGLLRRYSDAAAAWTAAALLLSSYSLWLLFGWPYIDLGVMLYALLAFIAALRWRESGQDGWLVLAGVFAGLLIGTKYTAGLMLVALLVYTLWSAPRRFLRSSLILGGVALLVFAPWMLKGAVLYGNPVYPFFLGGLNWDNERSTAFSHLGRGLLHSARWQIPVLPLAATVFGVEKGLGYSFTAGPWLLTAPLLTLIGWRWLDEQARQLTMSALVMMGVLLIGWMAGAAVSEIALTPRQAASYIALSAVVGAVGLTGLSRWPRKPFDLDFIVHGIVGFTLIIGLVEMSSATLGSRLVPYLAGSISRSAYLEGEIGLYSQAMRRLNELPEGSRVRLMWEPRAYYCPAHVECVPDALTDSWARAIRSGLEPEAVLAQWRGDYILLFKAGYDFYTRNENDDPYAYAAENRLFLPALERRMTLLWSDDAAYTLYGWRE